MNIDLRNAKILIVDDDRFFSDVLKKCVADHGGDCTVAESVEDAVKAVALLQPSVILTDVRMPGRSGLDLLQWSKATHPTIPVIVMTGFSDLLDSVSAAQNGASGFLAKPFQERDLLQSLNEALYPGSAEIASNAKGITISHEEGEFLKIAIEDFISGGQIKHPIFLRIQSIKGIRFVRVAHSGEDLSLERIRAYRGKGVIHLYLRREDFMEYLGIATRVSKVAGKTDIVSPEKKARLVRHTMELVSQHAYVNEIPRDAFEHALTITEVSTQILAGEDAGFMLLESLKEVSDDLYGHCAGVSMISTLIGRALGWVSPKTLNKVSMAGLLHDIGKRQLPRELALKSRGDMTPGEIVQYELHPKRGLEILSDKDFVPSDVTQAIYQHHERGNGSGFPNHLLDSKIYPLAKVVAVADEFCHLYFSSKKGEKPEIRAIFEKLMTFHAEGLGVEALIGLHRAFAIDLPPLLQKRAEQKEG